MRFREPTGWMLEFFDYIINYFLYYTFVYKWVYSIMSRLLVTGLFIFLLYGGYDSKVKPKDYYTGCMYG